MPPSPDDFKRRIQGIIKRVQPLPDEAKAPILHYRRTVADIWGALAYVERALGVGDRIQSVVDRHLGRLYGMALVNLVETFERFLKVAAAECVDCLAALTVDDRFSSFPVFATALASHFGSGSVGKALCESGTWLDCKEINDRFRKLLADPFKVKDGNFYIFPKDNQKPDTERWRHDLMGLIWQLRHTLVHNVGVITKSDAVKLRVWVKGDVDAPTILSPIKNDLRWLKLFLDDTAEDCNRRIGLRLAELLTAIHAEAPSLFIPADMANRTTGLFQNVLQVGGVSGVLPP